MKRTSMEKLLNWLQKHDYNYRTTEKYGCNYGNLSVLVTAYKIIFEEDELFELYGEGDTNGFSKEPAFTRYIKRLNDVHVTKWGNTYFIVEAGDFTALETFRKWRDEKVDHFDNWYHDLRVKYGAENVAAW